MKFDDEQLDELLRDIDAPESLKQKLRAIPQSQKNEVKHSQETANGVGWISLLAIAASLFLLVSLVIMSAKDANIDHDPITVLVDINESQTKPDNYDVVSDVDLELKLLKMKLQSIDVMLTQQKTKRMRQQLAKLKSSQLPILNSPEQQSIALSMSCQSAIEMGASVETFREELEQIKVQYPGLRGSEIASQLLGTQTFHN